MTRVLIADDQIPDDDIRDHDVEAWARKHHPGHKGWIDAFSAMREVVKMLKKAGYEELKVARRYQEALDIIGSQRFDIAIVDLGWALDADTLGDDERDAGWDLIRAIEAQDKKHPERLPTSKIIYSSRFRTHATLGYNAAKHQALPFYKPYAERHSLPLGDDRVPEDIPEDPVKVACESLDAMVKFVDELRDREMKTLLEVTRQGVERANRDQHEWHRLTLVMTAIGVAIVFAAVAMMLIGSVEQGIAAAVPGIVLSVFPRVMHNRLDKAQARIVEARKELERVLSRRTESRAAEALPRART